MCSGSVLRSPTCLSSARCVVHTFFFAHASDTCNLDDPSRCLNRQFQRRLYSDVKPDRVSDDWVAFLSWSISHFALRSPSSPGDFPPLSTQTLLKGWGLFAQQHIKEGSFVIEYVGEVINREMAQVRCFPSSKHFVLFNQTYAQSFHHDQIISHLFRSVSSVRCPHPVLVPSRHLALVANHAAVEIHSLESPSIFWRWTRTL